ncbi:MAG: sugar phosphate nucleotidyltransferase [Proteobacteria bacterium]|nr:sugar phosphate nucleotidyltransferase [Pseudomonadota bacterium]
MKTIILAGGKGTRLRDIVADVPKPMAPVGGKPFLEYIILALAAQGLREVILSVGYKKDIIRSYFGDGSRLGVNIVYSEEYTSLGTGGAVREALRSTGDRHSLILNGDTFNRFDYLSMEAYHVSTDALLTIALVHKNNVGRYGPGKNGRAKQDLRIFRKGTPGKRIHQLRHIYCRQGHSGPHARGTILTGTGTLPRIGRAIYIWLSSPPFLYRYRHPRNIPAYQPPLCPSVPPWGTAITDNKELP